VGFGLVRACDERGGAWMRVEVRAEAMEVLGRKKVGGRNLIVLLKLESLRRLLPLKNSRFAAAAAAALAAAAAAAAAVPQESVRLRCFGTSGHSAPASTDHRRSCCLRTPTSYWLRVQALTALLLLPALLLLLHWDLLLLLHRLRKNWLRVQALMALLLLALVLVLHWDLLLLLHRLRR